MELAADGDSPVCGKAPSGDTGPTGAEGGAASVGELAVGASRGRDVPRAAPCGRPPPVAQLLTSTVPSSSTATARATPRRPHPGPTHLPAATSAPSLPPNPPKSSKLTAVLPAVPAFPSPIARPRRYAAAGQRVRAVQEDGPVRRPDAMRRSREARPVPGPGWVCRPADSSASIGGCSLPGRGARGHRAAHPHPAIRQPHCPDHTRGRRDHRRLQDDLAAGGEPGRHLGLEQMVVIWASHSSNPAASTGQAATSRGRCGHGTSTCPCCLSPVHVRH